ncbi:hypothetical protein COHA_000643 [Chlorella ohadii]|uniref:Chloroplast envelope membrane protein n=1 Tax=Chlorella ohadii TaxID=2649997 RepID=A0AAD5DY35_9CHLO|nr:hypothetical protein COHA_000643 [Chlorella ohadii]
MPHGRRRSGVCHSFGDNLRRLGKRGDKSSVGEQSRDDPNGSSAAGPEQTSVWSDWQADSTSQDWESWEGINVADLDDVTEVEELREAVIERRRMRAGRRSKVRDEYIRPIVDAQGIVNRLIVDEAEAEERVFVEAITNQYESREAIKYLGALIGIPLAVGFVVSRFVATPLWDFAQSIDPMAFAPNDFQKIEGAHELHLEELRLRMEAAIGQAPPLTDEGVFEHLHKTAKHLDHEFREANKKALLNVVSDVTSGIVFFAMLSQQVPERQILFRTFGRIFTGLSDTSKAFLIILITDILLGYHSEEGWTATLRILSGHYGLEAEDELIHIFVATVPVLLDSLFKVG